MLELVGNLNAQISWTKWIKTSKSSTDSRAASENLYCSIEKVFKSGDLKELIQKIYDLAPEYLDHEHVKMNQSKAYKEFIAESMAEGAKKAVLFFDFAEKFRVIHQKFKLP